MQTLRPTLFLIACLLTAQVERAAATEHIVVFHLDEHHHPVTRLDRLPTPTAAYEALLALYALENGAGCEGKDAQGRVKCQMTRKLGLGSNCSDAHLRLVRAWFESAPQLTSRWDARNADAKAPGALEMLCYGQPDTASWHNAWEIIKLRPEGDTVEVEAILRWGSQYGHGRVRYRNSYRIGPQTITETSAEIKELSRSDRGIFDQGPAPARTSSARTP